jgi:hypothetical protein
MCPVTTWRAGPVHPRVYIAIMTVTAQTPQIVTAMLGIPVVQQQWQWLVASPARPRTPLRRGTTAAGRACLRRGGSRHCEGARQAEAVVDLLAPSLGP